MKALINSSFLSLMLSFSFGQAAAADLTVDIRFSTNEVSIIRDFYADQVSGRQPAKKEARQLPPGIAKNLGRGKPLPPGIAKQSLPGDLLGRLPPVAGGYERIIVDRKVLLIDVATQIIHDILTDIILH
jgi:hypothetical protein